VAQQKVIHAQGFQQKVVLARGVLSYAMAGEPKFDRFVGNALPVLLGEGWRIESVTSAPSSVSVSVSSGRGGSSGSDQEISQSHEPSAYFVLIKP